MILMYLMEKYVFVIIYIMYNLHVQMTLAVYHGNKLLFIVIVMTGMLDVAINHFSIEYWLHDSIYDTWQAIR